MNKLIKNISAIFGLTLSSVIVYAQDATSTAEAAAPGLWDQISGTDKLLLLIAFGLLIPIFYMGRIFNWSIKHYLKKRFDGKNLNSVIWIAALLLPTLLTAQTSAAPAAASTFDNFNFLRWFLLIIVFVEMMVLAFFGYMLYNQFAYFEGEKVAVEESEQSWLGKWWSKVNNFGSIEDEKKIDTGHNYDGIRELDNNIPAWFTAAFVGCVLFGVVYLWQYHVAKVSPLQIEELKIAEEEAELAHMQYLKTAGSGVDENALTLTTDKSEIDEGKKLFVANCAACHLADGGGNQGPNLTDDSWIYGCTPKDIYQSVKYGRKNGMMAWKDNFSDKQILQLSSFVKSLQGTKSATPKAAQGEKCAMTESTTTPAADSTKGAATVDSTVKK